MSEFSNFDKLHPRISTSSTKEHETGSSNPDKDKGNKDFLTITAPTPEAPKRSGFRGFVESRAGKATLGAAGLVTAAGLVFGGIKLGEGDDSRNAAPEKPAATTSEIDVSKLPQEEQDFINAYKDRFDDPIAAYNSQEAWLKDNPDQFLTVGDDYINSYAMGTEATTSLSPLGYELLKFSPDTAIDAQAPVKAFNEYLPQMNRFVNMLSKNPTTSQKMVIKDEFAHFDGRDNPGAQRLADTLGSVVDKYGPNAVYEINPATTDEEAVDASAGTIFRETPPIIDSVDESGKTEDFSAMADISVTVTTFDKDNKSSVTTEVLKDVQFSVMRTDDADPYNVGLVGIGASGIN